MTIGKLCYTAPHSERRKCKSLELPVHYTAKNYRVIASKTFNSVKVKLSNGSYELINIRDIAECNVSQMSESRDAQLVTRHTPKESGTGSRHIHVTMRV